MNPMMPRTVSKVALLLTNRPILRQVPAQRKKLRFHAKSGESTYLTGTFCYK